MRVKTALLIISFAGIFALCGSRVFAVTYTVDPDGTGDYPTIQAAIDAAVSGDIIQVEDGTYTGDGNRDIDFLGKAITVRGNIVDPNLVVIDCQGTEAEPHRGFKFVSGENGDSVLEGFTITNGYGPKEYLWNSGSFESGGGAIYCNPANPTINNCVLSNSSATWGGGIYNYNSSPTMNNCIIISNYAYYHGAGIYNYNCNSPAIINCTVNGNSGGGIFNYNSHPAIMNCRIINNSVSSSGGGIYNIYGSSAQIYNCIIDGNYAEYSGGGIFINISDPMISNCVISDNIADVEGGGIAKANSCSPIIKNCTIVSNSTSGDGGGVHDDGGSDFLTVYNSIVWNNQMSEIFGTVTVLYSNIQGGFTGVGNIDLPPLFADENYYLSALSPCINAGDPNYATDPNETDINGDPRVVLAEIDMGADEYYSLEPAIAFSVSEFNFAALQARENPSFQTLSFNNVGLAELNWNASCDSDWLNISPTMGSISYEQTAIITLDVDITDLSAGQYLGEITISDPNSINSPAVIDVNLIIVGPSLEIGQTDYSFTASKEILNPEPQLLTISNVTGGGTLNWSIVPDCNWMNIEPASGALTAGSVDVLLDIDQNNIEYGSHSCQLAVEAPNATNSPQVVTVTLDVLRPEMTLGQTSFSFTAESMANPPVSQVLTVQNTGYDTLNWTVTGASACDWLTVVPESGQTGSGGSTDVSLSVDPALAGYGSHSCELAVSDPNADNSPQVVTVTLDVLRPEISVSPSLILFECDVDEPNVLTQTLQISNIGYDTLNWSITEDCNWLSVSPASGQSQVDPSDATVTVDTAGLEVGLHRCDLSITDDNASNSPLIVPVTLHVYRVGERRVPIEYPTIQEAIDAAINGDHVIVHPGRYSGDGNEFIDFEGKEIVLRSIDPTDPESVDQTILIPDFLPIFSFNGHDNQSSIIDGLTIAGEENRERYQHEGFGIAIDCYASNSPLIRNCVFRDLVGEAVVYGNHSTMRFENCRFINNALWYSVLMSGGAGSMGEDSLSLKNCLIANNILFLDGQQFGSTCIYVYFTSLQMDGCTLAHNFAKSYLDSRNNRTGFPGIFASDSPVSIKNSIVWGNEGIPENNLNRQIVFYRFGQPSELSEPWVSVSQSDIQYGEGQILFLPDPDSFETYLETRELPDPNLNDPNWIRWEIGNMDADPLFSREPDDGGDGWFPDLRGVGYSSFYNNIPGDYHLKSEVGRFVWDGFARADFNWDKQVDLVDFSMMAQWWNMSVYSYPEWHHLDMDGGNMVINEVELLAFLEDYLQPRVFGEWATDDVTSPCIDAGDASDIGWQSELWPHGGRVNMGAYGGTPQASLSLNTVGNPADLNHDDAVDLIDWSLWGDDWMDERVLLDSDFDGSNIVDSNDLGIFLDNWLWAQ